MRRARFPLVILTVLLLMHSVWALPSSAGEKLPTRCLLPEVPYVQQIRNYCGPATLASILNYWKVEVDQKTIGKVVFDATLQATNGADMLLYARSRSLSAYSWNSSLVDLKAKLVSGVPVIVLQDSSPTDKSGHYRIVVGYDDASSVVYVHDPYEPQTKEMPYDRFEALWQRHGNWSLLICPQDRDSFKEELDLKNPVVHIDLAYVHFKRGDLDASERESRLALALEPANYSARTLLAKTTRAIGARSKNEKPKAD